MEESQYHTNKIVEETDDFKEYEFKMNFINTPWDYRSTRSKFGICVLLIAIFLATMACVVNSFVMHYRSYQRNVTDEDMLNCNLVKTDQYNFVARIYSISSRELLCLGAILSKSSILTSEVCVKSEPVILMIGSPSVPRCKKGFLVESLQPIYIEGIVSKKLVIISSAGNVNDCSERVLIGDKLDMSTPVYLIGRVQRTGRSLSRQTATPISTNQSILPRSFSQYYSLENVLCVKDLSKCPVQAGDLLIQNGFLFGLASISIRSQNNIACFTNIPIIHQVLSDIDTDIP